MQIYHEKNEQWGKLLNIENVRRESNPIGIRLMDTWSEDEHLWRIEIHDKKYQEVLENHSDGNHVLFKELEGVTEEWQCHLTDFTYMVMSHNTPRYLPIEAFEYSVMAQNILSHVEVNTTAQGQKEDDSNTDKIVVTVVTTGWKPVGLHLAIQMAEILVAMANLSSDPTHFLLNGKMRQVIPILSRLIILWWLLMGARYAINIGQILTYINPVKFRCACMELRDRRKVIALLCSSMLKLAGRDSELNWSIKFTDMDLATCLHEPSKHALQNRCIDCGVSIMRGSDRLPTNLLVNTGMAYEMMSTSNWCNACWNNVKYTYISYISERNKNNDGSHPGISCCLSDTSFRTSYNKIWINKLCVDINRKEEEESQMRMYIERAEGVIVIPPYKPANRLYKEDWDQRLWCIVEGFIAKNLSMYSYFDGQIIAFKHPINQKTCNVQMLMSQAAVERWSDIVKVCKIMAWKYEPAFALDALPGAYETSLAPNKCWAPQEMTLYKVEGIELATVIEDGLVLHGYSCKCRTKVRHIFVHEQCVAYTILPSGYHHYIGKLCNQSSCRSTHRVTIILGAN